ncbi:MAG: transcription initiation factor IIB [Nitrososphaerota archaeon]|nr:transcription initiation factor IIB [Nitrososphaerota archaeon]MDG6989984.1 transcription initiation factor IIB [Nitrososphaerota archaeon]
MSSNSNFSRLLKQERSSDRCPRCGKPSVVTDGAGAETYCSHCGLVIKEKIVDQGPEWRNFSGDAEKANKGRTGLPTSIAIHDQGLATMIGSTNRDASGRALSGSARTTVERMRTWDRRSQVHESADRNLRQAFSELKRFSDKLTVSEAVTEKAAYFYRKALERNLVRGRSITAIIAASLYAACRDGEIPRTLKDVAAVSNVKKKDLARSYRLLHREMDFKMPVADASKCVSGIASRAGMAEKTQRRAREILVMAKRMGLSAGKDPMGLAASALYVACTLEGDMKTQKDVAEAARVTEVTIRNRYKGLRSALGI